MNFNQDYNEFIEHLEKTCVLRPMKIDKFEDVAVRLFVTYLNIRYAKAHLTSDAADGEDRCDFCEDTKEIPTPDGPAVCPHCR